MTMPVSIGPAETTASGSLTCVLIAGPVSAAAGTGRAVSKGVWASETSNIQVRGIRQRLDVAPHKVPVWLAVLGR